MNYESANGIFPPGQMKMATKPPWGITLFVCLRVLLSHRPPPSSSYPLVADILPPKPPHSLAGFPSHLFPAIPLTPLPSLSKY